MPEPVSYSRIPNDVSTRWATVRDVCSGDQALRQGAYLPYLNRADYSQGNIARNWAYRQRAVLYTATSFTRDGLLGLAFRLDPRDELPERLKYLLKDADGSGTSIYQQSQEVLANLLEVGRHGLYVDFSSDLGRPVIKSYLAEDIINWRYATAGGRRVLSMVVLRETVEVEDGYGVLLIPQYREIKLEDGQCVVRIFRDGEKEPILHSMLDANGQNTQELVLRSTGGPLDFIPFTFIGSQNNDASIDTSPLYGLAQVNVAHFRNSADYEDSVFFVGQVQPVISGLTEEWRDQMQNPVDAQGNPTGQALYVGSRSPMLLPAGGTFAFSQAQPNMLVGEAMRHKETQMVSLGARLITEARARKTATGEDNDREATTSVLALCVSNDSEAYQTAIGWCARYFDMTGYDASSSYKINQDFIKTAVDPAVLAQIVAAWQTGIIAKVDVRVLLRRMGVVPTERTDEMIQSDLDLEGPHLGLAGLNVPASSGVTQGTGGASQSQSPYQ